MVCSPLWYALLPASPELCLADTVGQMDVALVNDGPVSLIFSCIETLAMTAINFGSLGHD